MVTHATAVTTASGLDVTSRTVEDRAAVGEGVAPARAGWADVVLLVGAIAVVEWLWFRPFLGGVDPTTVLDAAAAWPDLDVVDQRTARIGLVLPVAATLRLLGRGEVGIAALPLLVAAASVLATYALGRALAGRTAGVVAAVVVLASPTLMWVASRPYPDSFAMLAVVLGVLAAVTARDERRHRGLLLSGAAFGWAALCKVTAGPLVVVGWLAARPRDSTERAAFAVPFALAGLLQVLHDALVFGDPLARAGVVLGHDVTGQTVAGSTGAGTGGAAGAEGSVVVEALLGFWVSLAREKLGLALVAVALVALLVGLWRARRETGVRLLLWWWAIFWAVHAVPGGLLGDGATLVRASIARFWLPAWPAIALLVGIGCVRVLEAVRPALAPRAPTAAGLLGPAVRVGAVAAAVLGAVAAPLLTSSGHVVAMRAELVELRGWLEDHPQVTTVLTHEPALPLVDVYRRDAFGRALWAGRTVPGLYQRAVPSARSAPSSTALVVHTNAGTDVPPAEEQQVLAAIDAAGWVEVLTGDEDAEGQLHVWTTPAIADRQR